MHDESTTVGIHECRNALLREFEGGVKAGDEDRDFKRESRTASNRVLFRRSTHGLEKTIASSVAETLNSLMNHLQLRNTRLRLRWSAARYLADVRPDK
ncbi:MAG: hypothetical protein DMG80_11415 [Acidobacteria bacterium]|nr:MAG: hypothetical protein DMG80_11415 [Acidobacteriota bacterium]